MGGAGDRRDHLVGGRLAPPVPWGLFLISEGERSDRETAVKRGRDVGGRRWVPGLGCLDRAVDTDPTPVTRLHGATRMHDIHQGNTQGEWDLESALCCHVELRLPRRGPGAGVWSLTAPFPHLQPHHQHPRKLPSARVRWGPAPSPEARGRGGGLHHSGQTTIPFTPSLGQKGLDEVFCLGTQEGVLHVEVATSSVF